MEELAKLLVNKYQQKQYVRTGVNSVEIDVLTAVKLNRASLSRYLDQYNLEIYDIQSFVGIFRRFILTEV